MSPEAGPGRDTGARRGVPAALVVMVAVYAAVFVFVCAAKYRAFLYDDIDLAIFTEALANLLHGSLASSIRGASWLGDHSSLNLFLVAPLYALVRTPLTLLIVQSVALALGAIPVFRLARHETRDERAALALAGAYLLYPALGYLNLFEFHPEALSTPALLACFAALREGRLRATAGWAALALLGKEDVALVVGAMGVFALASRRRAGVKPAAALIGLAALSLALSFAVLKPLLAAGAPDYGTMYAAWGHTPGAIASAIVREPGRALMALFATPGNPDDSILKLQYWLHLLLPLAFLPLAAPEVLAIALPVIGEHMLSWRPQQHSILYQYTALVIPAFAAAAAVGLGRIAGWRRDPARGTGSAPGVEAGGVVPRTAARGAPARSLAVLALLAAVLSQALFGPLFGAGLLRDVEPSERTWPTDEDRTLALAKRRLLARVPAGTGVVASFELLAPLAGRDTLHALHHVVSGHYTFSDRPFPTPAGVGALVADFADPLLAIYPDMGSGARLRGLIETNRLALVEARGSLRLYLRDAYPIPPRVGLSTCGSSAPPVVYDRQLAFAGISLAGARIPAGAPLEFTTCWRSLRPVDRLYLTEWLILDGSDREVASQMRYLGEMIEPPSDWPVGREIGERYSWPAAAGLAPGSYRLAMRVGGRRAGSTALAEPDDPGIRSRGGVVPLATFEVLPGPVR